MARSRASLAETGIGQEERSALLGTGLQNGEMAMEAEMSMEETDPTQQLLLSLGQFQKTVKGARKRSDTLWSDECMNQLILGVELSLSHGWPHLVDAFTDAGRILQTYENANRVYDALPFLENSYEVLCAVAGDVMGGGSQTKVLEQWNTLYDDAVQDVLNLGLKLVDDTEDDSASAPDESSASLTPFEVNEVDAAAMRGESEGELPTLDELPPLDNMMSTDSSASDVEAMEDEDIGVLAEEVINTAQAQAEASVQDTESPADKPVAEPEPAEPSRTVVDIVDRICDELAELKERSPEDRILALEMIEGGIGALLREAKQSGFSSSMELCEVMGRASKCMPDDGEEVDERFTEICFAFCGVFVEAMSDPGSENVVEWLAECEGLIAEWTPETTETVTEASASEPVVELPQEEIAAEVAPTPEQPAQESVLQTPAPSASPIMESQALFEMAQQALMSGDAEGAKNFALQAAAAIAEAEATSAESLLAESETRLKLSLNSTAEARGGVTETEKLVKSASSHVAAGKRALGEAKERTASMAQDVVEAEESVAELEAQIADLQARRDQCAEQTISASERLNEARGNESSVSERLDGLRAAELESRKNLESSRQHVKDLQRNISEIEMAMEKARDALTRHKISLEDIRQTMSHPQTQAPTSAESK